MPTREDITAGTELFNFLKNSLMAAGNVVAEGTPIIKIVKFAADGTRTVLGAIAASELKGNPDTSFEIVAGLGKMCATSLAKEAIIFFVDKAAMGAAVRASTTLVLGVGVGSAVGGVLIYGQGLEYLYNWSKENPGMFDKVLDALAPGDCQDGICPTTFLDPDGGSTKVLAYRTNPDGSITLSTEKADITKVFKTTEDGLEPVPDGDSIDLNGNMSGLGNAGIIFGQDEKESPSENPVISGEVLEGLDWEYYGLNGQELQSILSDSWTSPESDNSYLTESGTPATTSDDNASSTVGGSAYDPQSDVTGLGNAGIIFGQNEKQSLSENPVISGETIDNFITGKYSGSGKQLLDELRKTNPELFPESSSTNESNVKSSVILSEAGVREFYEKYTNYVNSEKKLSDEIASSGEAGSEAAMASFNIAFAELSKTIEDIKRGTFNSDESGSQQGCVEGVTTDAAGKPTINICGPNNATSGQSGGGCGSEGSGGGGGIGGSTASDISGSIGNDNLSGGSGTADMNVRATEGAVTDNTAADAAREDAASAAQEDAARAAYNQALQDTAAISSATNLAAAIASGDGLAAAAAAIRLMNNSGATSAIAGENATSVGNAMSAVASGLDLVNAISDGNYVSAAGSAVNMLKDVGQLSGLSSSSSVIQGLDAVGGALSAVSAIQGLTSGDALTQVQSVGNLVVSLDAAYQGISSLAGTAGSLLPTGAVAGIGLVTSVISLVQALDSGNPAAIASSAVQVGVAAYSTAAAVGLIEVEAALACAGPYGWVAAAVVAVVAVAVSIFGGDLFGGDDPPPPPPPPPTGEGHFVRNADGSIGIVIEGTNGGYEILQGQMTAILAHLQQEAAESGTVLVPERLPSVKIVSWQSYSRDNFIYQINLNDPVTGEAGKLSVSPLDLVEKCSQVSSYTEGFVHEWEANQIEAKLADGDAHYAETDGQYAHRVSATGDTDTAIDDRHQAMSAIVVDLAGNGVPKIELPETVGKSLMDILNDGVARFDADDDGYREAAEWITAGDAFLALDRDGDGQIDNARELLSGRNIAEDIRGEELLKWLDANGDGTIDRNDPAFAALKLWLDVNGDGASDTKEVFSLSDLGIEAIDINGMALKFADGYGIGMEETELEAEKDGISLWREERSRNLVVDAENGTDGNGTDARLNYVVEADDLTQLAKLTDPEANLSEEERSSLIALAQKYGFDPEAPDFAETVRTLSSGGGNVEGSPAAVYIKDGEVVSDEDPAEGGSKSRRTIQRILQAASEDPSGMFTGAAAGLMAVGLGVDPVQASMVTVANVQSDIPAAVTPVHAADYFVAGGISSLPPEKIITVSADNVFSLSAKEGEKRTADNAGIHVHSSDVVSDKPAVSATPSIQWKTVSIASVIPDVPASASSETGNDRPAKIVTVCHSDPQTTADYITSEEDNRIIIPVQKLLENDFEEGGGYLQIISVGNAQHGTVRLNGDGTIFFDPDADYNGDAGFVYTVMDCEGNTRSAAVRISIEAANDMPVVNGETITDGAEDTGLRIAPALLLANDVDVDVATNSQTLSVVSVDNAAHGTVALDTNGDILFIPDTNFHGTASFDYTVSDGAGGLVTGTAKVEVAAANDAPVVTGETITDGVEDTELRIAPALLLANDTDVDTATDGQVLSIAAVGNAAHGSVSLDANGEIIFSPDADFHGTASFEYTVSDGAGGLTVGTAKVEVASVNDAPVAVGESVSIDEDNIAVIPQSVLLANDTDVDVATDGDTLHIVSLSNASHGTTSFNDEGEVVFVPDANYNGIAGFDYVVEDSAGAQSVAHTAININSVPDAPTAVGETFSGGVEDAKVYISFSAILQNDYDVEGDAINFAGIVSSSNGTASVDLENQRVVFTPDANFSGTAGFDYKIADSTGLEATAHMNVQIAAVNDNPVACADGITILEDGGATSYNASWATVIYPATSLLANDSDVDGDTLSVNWVGNSTNCTVALQNDGSIRITTSQNYCGTAGFQYQVSDGHGCTAIQSVSVDVLSVNDAPVIQALECGRPIFCYEYMPSHYEIVSTQDGDNFVLVEDSWKAVYSETNALSLFQHGNWVGYASIGNPAFPSAAGSVYSYAVSCPGTISNDPWTGTKIISPAESIQQMSPTNYYHNGTLVPIAMDINDLAYPVSFYPPVTYEYQDNPFYENGRIIAYDPDGDSSALTYTIISNSVYGHANLAADWGDDNGNLTQGLNDQPGSRTYYAGDPCQWVYQSQNGCPYNGAAPFTVRVTDGAGAYTDVQINVHHEATWTGGSGSGKPVAIDLDGDGLEFVNINDANVLFDINGDGWREHLAWTSADDGLLAYDKDSDGVINQHDEISFVDYKEGAQTDLEGLQAFDTDGDGKLTSGDGQWSKFGVWQDKNLDGVTDDGEFRHLSDLGISSINLTSDGKVENRGDVLLFGTTTCEKTDGSTCLAGDAMFRYTSDKSGTAASAVNAAAVSATDTQTAAELPASAPVIAPAIIAAALDTSHQTTAQTCPVPAFFNTGAAIASAPADSHAMSDADIARLLHQFISDCAGAMVQPPASLDIPASAPPLEVVIAQNVMHEFMEQTAPAPKT